MKLTVVRQDYLEDVIAGELLLEGIFECYTAEHPKLFCPEGTYPVALEYSPKFGRLLPELKDIPGRSEIKFHAGNFPITESQGCILVGRVRMRDGVMESGLALSALMAKLIVARNNHQKFTVEITRAGGGSHEIPFHAD